MNLKSKIAYFFVNKLALLGEPIVDSKGVQIYKKVLKDGRNILLTFKNKILTKKVVLDYIISPALGTKKASYISVIDYQGKKSVDTLVKLSEHHPSFNKSGLKDILSIRRDVKQGKSISSEILNYTKSIGAKHWNRV